jgi:hypothetical protein
LPPWWCVPCVLISWPGSWCLENGHGVTEHSITLPSYCIPGLRLCPFSHRQSLDLEDGGKMDLWNARILPQHYTASQPRRPRLELCLLNFSDVHHLFLLCFAVSAQRLRCVGGLGMYFEFSFYFMAFFNFSHLI